MTTDSTTPLRIHIAGNAGSGKTTLAVALGQRLGLPVHHHLPYAFRSRP